MRWYTVYLLWWLAVFAPHPCQAFEARGKITTEASLFMQSPAYDEQAYHSGALNFEAEAFHHLNDQTQLNIELFSRIDSNDRQRPHLDLRACSIQSTSNGLNFLVGLDKVFWGVTEFVHLVDIINQVDLVASFDYEEKLGQPMILGSKELDWGTIEFYYLPFFRPRNFPGAKDRLRSTDVIDEDKAVYESQAKKTHPDFALRYSHTWENIDLGLAHFIGTSREPVFLFTEDQPSPAPYYQQIGQTSIDVQLVAGNWLWKLEALYRTGHAESYGAMTGGFEYTLVNPLQMEMDIGFIAEYVYDQRSDETFSPYDNDLMLGLRLSSYDVAGTTVLCGLIQDLEKRSTLFTLEASRRIGNSLSIDLTGVFFIEVDTTDPSYWYRDDSHLTFKITYYF